MLLTTADPIKLKSYIDLETNEEVSAEINKYYFFEMNGAEGAYYGVNELNKICSIYKNDLAEEARSINVDDINNVLGLAVKYDDPNAGVYKKEDINYLNNFNLEETLGKTYTYIYGDKTPASKLGLEEIKEGHQEKGTAYTYI